MAEQKYEDRITDIGPPDYHDQLPPIIKEKRR